MAFISPPSHTSPAARLTALSKPFWLGRVYILVVCKLSWPNKVATWSSGVPASTRFLAKECCKV
jgi:hypothetical protein